MAIMGVDDVDNNSIQTDSWHNACFPPSRNVTCRNVSILRTAKTYVKILSNVRYFYVRPK